MYSFAPQKATEDTGVPPEVPVGPESLNKPKANKKVRSTCNTCLTELRCEDEASLLTMSTEVKSTAESPTVPLTMK